MKPHLPVRLFRAVALVLAAAPAALYAEYSAPTEIVVPDSYTNSVELSGAVDFTAQTANTAYRLTGDVSMTPSGASFSDVSYLYTSDSANNLASIGMTEPSGSTKVGVTVSSQLSFDSLQDVTFKSFSTTTTAGGSAIVYTSGNLIFSNNAEVTFQGNKVLPTGNNDPGRGGSLDIQGRASFQNNAAVNFSDNEARTEGGAVSVYRRRASTTDKLLLINGNEAVVFSGNRTANKISGFAGALYNLNASSELNGNGVIEFSGNAVKSTTTAQGGAIYSRSTDNNRVLTDICYNDSVSFVANLAQASGNSSGYAAQGGAICALGCDLRMDGNGYLIFKDNKAYGTDGQWRTEGGAIRVGENASLSIQNNGTVIFENNLIQAGSTVKYNSIYADDASNMSLQVNISAPELGSVEFRDCVYIDVSNNAASYLNLNSTFTDESGNKIAQTGDIIFTGSYMTSGDKTSEIKGTASLLAGRLIVKDGAVLKAGALSIASGATLELSDGTMSGSITVENGTVKGSGTLGALTMNGGDLVVGNSPGVQVYEGDVVLNDVEVTFSLADFDAAATAETQGWDSSAYSVIDMNGHNLTIGEDVTFTFEIGGEALSQLLNPTGEAVSFSLELFRNIDTLTLNDKTIEDLIAASEFIITSDEEGLQNGLYAEYAGQNITEQVTSAFYTTEDGKVVLNVSMTTVPEPTTATLSLLALAALAARRRRR